MKNIIIAVLAVLGMSTFVSCSNGEYIANEVTAANSSSNPLDPRDSVRFDWTGNNTLSAVVAGNSFSLDSTNVTYMVDSLGGHIITAFQGAGRGLYLRFANIYGAGVYTSGYGNVLRMGVWYDTIPKPKAYFSYFGNVGQVQIIRNDHDRIMGRFYFQTVDTFGGNVINIDQGWFNVPKG